MNQIESSPEPAGFSLNDLIFIVFRHKWKLLCCFTAGLVAASFPFFGYGYVPEYVSEAKLLVRYVVDKSAVDQNEAQVKPGNLYGNSVMSAEVEILTSWDLMQRIAEALTIERILPQAGTNATITDAALAIQAGLRVGVPGGNSVITVGFQSRDPELPRLVLNRLVTEYFEKHLQVHRSVGTFDFVSQQTDQVRARLAQTEDELKKLKTKAGIRSIEKSEIAIDRRMQNLQNELDLAEAQREELIGKIVALGGAESENIESERAIDQAPSPHEQVVERYRELTTDLTALIKVQHDLRLKYTPENRTLKTNQSEISRLKSELRDIEEKFPGIGAAAPERMSDFGAEKAQLSAIEAKIKKLRASISAVDGAAEKLEDFKTEIIQLERKRDADAASFAYFHTSLEKARIDEALDPTKMPNISILQSPSPSAIAPRDSAKKMIQALVGGGLALGVALVLLTELIIDPSVKRPSELQARMGIPLLVSIPYLARCDRRRLSRKKRSGGSIPAEEGGAEPENFSETALLRQSFESIRDRLIVFFELNNVRHRPKLVAVTGCSGGGGTSTIAGGLAAALAETGDGKVLLVDMNGAHAAVHPYFEGRPSGTVTEALQAEITIPSASENLYLAKAQEQNNGSFHLVPKRFSDMVSGFKASVYDYIVFDLPPLDQSCAALAIARSVDKVLLVVETGKTHREAVKRVYGDLVASRANVSCILNKNKTFGSNLIQSAS